jgi:predicted enzyme related to lactoylglutathione lyase
VKREEPGTAANRGGATLSEFYRAAFDGTDRPEKSDLGPGIPTSIEVGNLEVSLSRVWDGGGTILSVLVASTGVPMSATIRDPAGNQVVVVAAG